MITRFRIPCALLPALLLTGASVNPPRSQAPEQTEPARLVLDEDTVWSRSDSPIVVDADVTVAQGATLTIEPGVEVRIEGKHTLTVEGTLLAQGLPGNEIVWLVDGRRVLSIDRPTVVGRGAEVRESSPATPAVLATDLAFDAATREIRYTLAEPALVRIRIGVRDGGPLLRTLIDWEHRPAGTHLETWNGRDGSGRVEFDPRDDLMVILASLPLHPDPQSEPRASIRGRRNAPRFTIAFPEGTDADEHGVPVLRAATPVRITIEPEDFEWLRRAAFELAMYVDAEFVAEDEEGNNPFDYPLDPAGLTPGRHDLTVNVIGFEGEIGTRSVRFVVAD